MKAPIASLADPARVNGGPPPGVLHDGIYTTISAPAGALF
jgi:hypothetical protein